MIYLIILSVCLFSNFDLSENIDSIKVYSSLGGYISGGFKNKDTLVILKKGKAYVANEDAIPNKYISDFIEAINEQLVDSFYFENMGVTQKWLNNNAEEAFYSLDFLPKGYVGYTDNQKKLFIDTFTDISLIKRIFSAEFSKISTFRPAFNIEIFNGNQIFYLQSESYLLFMIPWEITYMNQKHKTYNTHISIQLAKLLPDGFSNKNLIEQKTLFDFIVSGVWNQHVRSKWSKVAADDKAEKDIEVILQKYNLKNYSLGGSYPLHKDSIFHANMSRSDLPANYDISVDLVYENGKIDSLDKMFRDIDNYLKLCLSTDWLVNVLKDNDSISVTILYEIDRSLGGFLFKHFAWCFEDRDPELFNMVLNNINECVCLEMKKKYEYAIRWIILPSKESILWWVTQEDILDDLELKKDIWKDYARSIVGETIKDFDKIKF